MAIFVRFPLHFLCVVCSFWYQASGQDISQHELDYLTALVQVERHYNDELQIQVGCFTIMLY